MSETARERIEAEYDRSLEEISAADLTTLIPHILRFGLGRELESVIRTARPSAKVQSRFLPVTLQAEILKSALRNAKAQELVVDAVVGMYADDLGNDVADPTLEQLSSATAKALSVLPRSLVEFTLLGVVARDELAKPHAITVLRDTFACDLTR